MFSRKETDLTFEGKKFTVGSYSVAQSIAFKSRFRRAREQRNDEDGLKLMVDMVLGAIIKPKVSKDQVEAMAEDDLHGFLQAICEKNGFAVAGEAKGKGRKKS